MYVIIMLADRDLMSDMYCGVRGDLQVQTVKDGVARGAYTMSSSGVIKCEYDLKGEDVADEMFDLTNNPGRQVEREMIYGNGRSLSVGDIVIVDGEMFACLSFGWAKL